MIRSTDMPKQSWTAWVLLALLTVMDDARAEHGKPGWTPRMVALLEEIARAPTVAPLRGPWPGQDRLPHLDEALRFLDGVLAVQAIWGETRRARQARRA